MSEENSCNNGDCKLLRMTGDRNHNHVNDTKTKGRNIIPEKAIKNMKKIVILFIIVAAIVAYVIQSELDPSIDFLNATTLGVEIVFGAFIALIVYVYSKRQHEENTQLIGQMKALIDEVYKVVGKQEKFSKERESSAKMQIGGVIVKLRLVIGSMLYELKEYEEKKIIDEDMNSYKKNFVKRIRIELDELKTRKDSFSEKLSGSTTFSLDNVPLIFSSILTPDHSSITVENLTNIDSVLAKLDQQLNS